jgi:plasmid stabilization system protein ParE
VKRYRVVFEVSAQTDVRESYEWGCRVWGSAEADKWLRQLRVAVSRRLAVLPFAFPHAAENEEFVEEIRQMIVGRYRVLFTIKDLSVHVLHVRGAYVEDDRPTCG